MSKYQIFRYRFIILITGLVFCTSLLRGQSPYELSLKKDIPLLVGGILSQATGLAIVRKVNPLSLTAIEALNIEDINSFDRKAIYNYSTRAKNQSDVILFTSYIYPFSLFLSKEIRNDFMEVSVIGTEVIVWTVGLTTITKALAKRPRPFVYNQDAPIEDKQKRTARLSFFSGHTSTVSAASFFTAKVFSDYYPDSKWKPVVWSVAVLLPATTGYLRYKAGKHFPTDVMGGFACGALVGILIPQLHKKKDQDKKVSLSVLPVFDGVGLVLRW